MQLYFEPNLRESVGQIITLDSNTSKHLVQVLRAKVGTPIALTNGNGRRAEATITQADKWNCKVRTTQIEAYERTKPLLSVAVSFTKNKARNEWLLEKLTEIGVAEIIPINCQRTEKEKLNPERAQSILIAAMLQSKQYFLPHVAPLTALAQLDLSSYPQGFVAHCMVDAPKKMLHQVLQPHKNTLILIGPEGDFTPSEIEGLLNRNIQAISLGSNRLRTETAAMYAATIFNALNDE